jgi:membrane-bound serine protease (ClpP class)
VTPPGGEDKGGEKKAPGAEGAVEMQKLVNDLAAHMRSLAVNRHRNAEVAENMVRESVSLTEREALDAGLIELVAKNRSEVFAFLREHPIYRSDGSRETLALGENLAVEDIPMSARERFLTGLANPALAYVLLLLGALGLFVEFKSPGLIFPGIIGAIFILLYLMSIPLLPVNVVGLLLILLGIVFFILEVKVVSYGMLTVGGVVSLVLGSVLLYDKAPIPELRLSLTVILPVALAFSGIIVFLLVLAARAMRNPVKTGEEGFVGKVGEVREAIEPPGEGKVFVFGEYWTAVSDAPIGAGERVRVVECRGMTVKVEPLSKGGSRA